MKRSVVETKDGSKTLIINDLNETYHSTHGALQEGKHVFIKNGLNLIKNCEINILELGFGTGLNLLLTIDEYLKNNLLTKTNYYSIEKYPLKWEEVALLDYPALFQRIGFESLNHQIHHAQWNEDFEIVPNFFVTKIETDFYEINHLEIPEIDLVYFDCFGARVQPDLWEKPLLEIVSRKMKLGGLLTTYSSKGSFRRTLQELDFEVEKKPGPPGKREMINAWKK